MVVVDSTILLLLMFPDTPVPTQEDGTEVIAPAVRVRHWIDALQKSSSALIVPTPVLSEVLIKIAPERRAAFIDELRRYSVIRVVPFDARAAFELADMAGDAARRGQKKNRPTQDTYAKLKYDRQIVAIARVEGATAIYSDDEGLKAVAGRADIRVHGIASLPLPASFAQTDLFPARRIK